MGAVYEVVHLDTERHRALKVMHPHILQSQSMRERFKREAKVAANVVSEHIVDVFDAGVDEATDCPFMVMELLRGEELGKLVKRVGRLTTGEATLYLYQAALALDATHKASIVHRDVKPANLFLTEPTDGQRRIKVLDFGVAKLVAENSAEGATATVGTPVYMAPEQFNPNAKLTGAADIYALGMVAYTLLTGRAYWAAEAKAAGVYGLAAVSLNGPQEPASHRAAERGLQLPPGFDAWFSRMTARDPAARFATATEGVRALGVALSVPFSSFASGQVWELLGPSSSVRSPIDRFSATQAGLMSTRNPDEGAPSVPSAHVAQSSAETTMHPAIRVSGTLAAAEFAPWNRKRAIVGALGALALGMLIGLGSDALRSRHSASGPADPAVQPIVGLASADRLDRVASTAPSSPKPSAAPSEAPATPAPVRSTVATVTNASLSPAGSVGPGKAIGGRNGDRRPVVAPKPIPPPAAPKPTAGWSKMYTRE